MSQVMFDLDVLRSFATGMALGSYARAADKLGRSTSAVSAQLKKLESQAGTVLFRKAGRGLELTDAGETLLAYAHRMLELNEEANAAMRGVDLQGWVRLGLQEDFGETLLPAVLGRFARAHPKVRIEACVARSGELRERLELGKLDLALAWDAGDHPLSMYAERVARCRCCGSGPRPAVLDAPWWTERERREGQAGVRAQVQGAAAAGAARCAVPAARHRHPDARPRRPALAPRSRARAWPPCGPRARRASASRCVRRSGCRRMCVRSTARLSPAGAAADVDGALPRAGATPRRRSSRLATLLLEAVRQHVQVAPAQMH
jgi:hypothetical protein